MSAGAAFPLHGGTKLARMRQLRIAMLADRLTALLPKNGLSVSGHDAKTRLQYHDPTITEHDFEGAVALAAARGQITRTFGGAGIARWREPRAALSV